MSEPEPKWPSPNDDEFPADLRGATNLVRDLELLRSKDYKEKVLKENARIRERLTGKLQDVRKKLDPKIRKYSEALLKELGKDPEDFYHLLSVYEYLPATNYDVALFVRYSDFLNFTDVVILFDFLVENFQSKFDSSLLIALVNETNFSKYLNRVLRYPGLSRRYPDEKERKKGVLKIVERLVNRPIREVYALLGDDVFKKYFAGLKKIYPQEASVSGLLHIVAQNHEDIIQTYEKKVDTKEIEAVFGDLYKGNEIVFIFAKSLNEEAFLKTLTVMKNLKKKRPYEILKAHSFTHIFDALNAPNAPDPETTADFINWLENSAVFNFASIGVLATAYRRMAMAFGKENFMTEESNTQLKKFEQSTGLVIDMEYFLRKPDLYIWDDESLLTIVRLREAFDFRLNVKNLENTKKIVESIATEGLLEILLNSDYAPLLDSLVRDIDYEDGGKIEDLAAVFSAYHSLKAVEKDIPAARDILTKLRERGVRVSCYSNSNELRKLLGPMNTKPELLDKFLEIAELYEWDKITLKDFYRFERATKTVRTWLLDRKKAKVLKGVLQSYNLPVRVKFLLEFASQVQVRKGMSEIYEKLKTPKLKAFYKNNQKLFAATSSGYYYRLEAVVSLYEAFEKNPSMLLHAKRWVSLGHSIYSDFVDIDFSVLEDSRFNRCKHVFEKLGIKYLTVDIALFSKVLDTLEHFEDPAFHEFLKVFRTNYDLEVDSTRESLLLLKCFKTQAERSFLMSSGSSNFYTWAKKYGYELDLENIEEFMVLAKHPKLKDSVEKFVDFFKVKSVASQVRALKGFSFDLSGVKKRGFNFLSEMAELTDSGKMRLLMSRKCREVLDYLHSNLDYVFSIADIYPLLTILGSTSLQKAIKKPSFAKTFRKFREYDSRILRSKEIYFRFGLIDSIVVISENLKEFEKLMAHFSKEFSFRLDSASVVSIWFLLTQPRSREKVFEPGFVKTVKTLMKNQAYKFNLDHVHTLIYLSEHPEIIGPLFSKDMNNFLRDAGINLRGEDLVLRLVLYRQYENTELREVVISDEFKTFKQNLLHNYGLGSSAFNPEMMVLMMDHPEVMEFLDGINLDFGFYDSRTLHFFDSMPNLIGLAATNAELHVNSLSAKYEDYSFNPYEALTWIKLIKKYPDVNLFMEKVAEAVNVIGEENINLNKIYMFLVLGTKFEKNRTVIEDRVKPLFKDDVHRVDHNFSSYMSYNKIGNFNLVELNKISLLLDWFEDGGNCKTIGSMIHKDVEEFHQTELGSLFTLESNARVKHKEYPPRITFNNGNYLAPPEAANQYGMSTSLVHLHAVSFASGKFAGPSGGRFSSNADIMNAQKEGLSSTVITSLSKTEFAVHFYNPRGDVVFLGRYQYSI